MNLLKTMALCAALTLGLSACDDASGDGADGGGMGGAGEGGMGGGAGEGGMGGAGEGGMGGAGEGGMGGVGGVGGAGGMGGEGGGEPAPTAADVQAIYDARCGPCHTAGAATGGINLDDHVDATVGVLSVQADMDLITPGDRDASYLWRKLVGTHLDVLGGAGQRMPTTGSLDQAELDVIGGWIDAGAEGSAR